MRVFVCLLCIFGIGTARTPESCAQEKAREFRIQLDVSASGSFESEVRSYLSRELRQLSGVKLVEEDPEYVISVVALQDISRSNDPLGYTISVVTLDVVDSSAIRMFFNEEDTCADRLGIDILAEYIGEAYHLRDHRLLTGPPDQLRGACEKIVARFDAEVLEPSRLKHQSILDMVEKFRSRRDSS